LHFLREQCVFVALILTIVVFAILTPKFFTVDNITMVFRQRAIIGIIACSMTLVLVSAHFDLSVGAIVSFSAVTVIQLFNALGPGPAIAVVLALGILIGLANGFLIGYLRLDSMIVTLGMTGIVQASTYFVSGGQNSVLKNADGSWFLWLGRSSFGVIPVISIIWVGFMILYHIILKRAAFGYRIRAIGGNRVASGFSGIKVKKNIMTAFVLNGFMAAFAGIALASRVGSAQNTIGEGYELDAITAVVLGGTAINGGRGSVVKTFIGVLVLGVINSGLTMLGLKYYVQWLANGLVILVVVLIDVLAGRNQGGK